MMRALSLAPDLMAALSERAWAPDRTDVGDFFTRLEHTDWQLSRFIHSAWPASQWPYWIQRPVEKAPPPAPLAVG